MSQNENLIRVPPNHYIHVIDNNTNITRLEVGPKMFMRKDQEEVTLGPVNMINLAPNTFCKILNPVVRNDTGELQTTYFGQTANKFGEFEIRTNKTYEEPFPLYPNEELVGTVQKLQVVLQNTALRFEAIQDFMDGKVQRKAGEVYQRDGPFTYTPIVEEKTLDVVKAQTIRPNTALQLVALQNTVDVNGVSRKVGEQWLIRKTGSYLPNVNEQIVQIVQGRVLTDQICLQIRALMNFTDIYGIKRLAGTEWLITSKTTQMHIQDVHEEIVVQAQAVTLTSSQYCYILNPMDSQTGTNLWGGRVLKQGESTFFMQPGEELECGIEDAEVLEEDQALLLRAVIDFTDSEGNKRQAGGKWLIQGPREYVPPVEVEVLEHRNSIPLDENEGIYVRNNNTGEIKAISGQTYLLAAHESLWEKELPDGVEILIARAKTGQAYTPAKKDANGKIVYQGDDALDLSRDKTRIVTLKAPHNSVVQLYDYKQKKNRIVFGPELVMLGPDENFTVLSLSGGKTIFQILKGAPKRENAIQSLALSLGPDFMTDSFIVETSDHARLQIQLAYNWFYRLNKEDLNEVSKIFNVKDFIGDACKTIASRVRGAVSAVTFEDFHHHSGFKIREAVFGKNKDGSFREELVFKMNNLVITSVDIQNMEVTDARTRENLSQSINMAIEIQSQSQEMVSHHQADRLDQLAQGQLQRQKLEDETKSEQAKIKLLKLQAESLEVSSKGVAIAKAKAECEALLIKGHTEVKQAELRAQAKRIEAEAEYDQKVNQYRYEVKQKKDQTEIELLKTKELNNIEIKKFKEMVNAIGKETLCAIARAGPETKARILKGLGLQGYLVTDGKNPINLFNTANGLMGANKK